MENILQLKIVLDDSKPPIWRRVNVLSSLTFYDLHIIIQKIMPWDDDHLHSFMIDCNTFIENDYKADLEDSSDVLLDYKVRLHRFLKKEKQMIKYSYDFGDSWEHTIIVEKIIKADGNFVPAVCLDGKRNAPIEDCGGIPGYYCCLEYLKNSKNPNVSDYGEWLEDMNWDPEYFELENVNANLKRMFKSK